MTDYGFGSASFTMPTVLAKLGADVLAVNPYASTQGAMGFAGEQAAPARPGPSVTAAGAQLGAVIDAGGERLTLIDDEGRVLTDTQALLALVRLIAPHIDGDTHRRAGERHPPRRGHGRRRPGSRCARPRPRPPR